MVLPHLVLSLLPFFSAVKDLRPGLSPYVVGIFEQLRQAQYPKERREVLRGNLLERDLHPVAELVDCHFFLAALLDGLFKFFLDVLQRGLGVGGGLVFQMGFLYILCNAVQIVMQDMAEKVALLYCPSSRVRI